jgi:nitrite reductase/ring-hydroxylating ferredoxin subunit/multimeric flavodoxin WrbA
LPEAKWRDLGPLEAFTARPLQHVVVDGTPLAVSYADGALGVVSGVCNHVGGPLGEGRLDGDYIVCPWHQWKFQRRTGLGEPGFEDDRVPSHELRVENGQLLVNLTPQTTRHKTPHDPHPLARPVVREPGPLRVAGISTTAMDRSAPRYSGSDALLEAALAHAAADLEAHTRLIRLNELSFRACEGYYSKAARACTWPCSITQMDSGDQLDAVYEALVHWADVILLATPIRWGAASSLYYRMAERMNCVQNQITTHDRVLVRNKVAAFIIVGGQDNIQAVAGQLLAFFAELGFLFPQFPFVAHSRGWSAEDMEQNVAMLKASHELREGAERLVGRALAMAGHLVEHEWTPPRVERGGRKAHRMATDGENRPS